MCGPVIGLRSCSMFGLKYHQLFPYSIIFSKFLEASLDCVLFPENIFSGFCTQLWLMFLVGKNGGKITNLFIACLTHVFVATHAPAHSFIQNSLLLKKAQEAFSCLIFFSLKSFDRKSWLMTSGPQYLCS